MVNRLARETSPYLLQHQNNPVDWWPWGPEALQQAQSQGKPILLSIGYAACHWCHVMAHETFENPALAEQMNRDFINIKVDREERPDLDALYQSALTMMGQNGGWPLTIFLTPQGEPFWGGTYFPPTDRYGRPGFGQVLSSLVQTWRQKPDDITGNVEALKAALSDHYGAHAGSLPSLALLEERARRLLRSIDPIHGGLEGAPKFPMPVLFAFLWRTYLRTGDQALAKAVITTLDHLCQGGIYDHLGGGFARYSTDDQWLAPHFEKMLYDNAQLIELLTLVWQETRSPLYAARIRETIGWILREMQAEGGAFAASLDADSEGEEGRFYVWTKAQLDNSLGVNETLLLKEAYEIHRIGNWDGKLILRRNHNADSLRFSLEQDLALAPLRARLLAERDKRVRPGRDDKILADWNGLTIAALAQAGWVFDEPDWIAAASQAFAFIQRTMSKEDRLLHSLRQGRVQKEAMLDDYASMALAALALLEATGEPAYLTQAQSWVESAHRYYWDEAAGGYFLAAADADDIILRPKTARDGALPSGNGLMVQVLAKLHHLTGEDFYRQRAEQTICAFAGDIAEHAANMPSLLAGFEMLTEPTQIVLIAEPSDPALRQLRQVVQQTSLPNRILITLTPGQSLPASHPAGGKSALRGQATAYVCHGLRCTAPVTDADGLRAALSLSL